MKKKKTQRDTSGKKDDGAVDYSMGTSKNLLRLQFCPAGIDFVRFLEKPLNVATATPRGFLLIFLVSLEGIKISLRRRFLEVPILLFGDNRPDAEKVRGLGASSKTSTPR